MKTPSRLVSVAQKKTPDTQSKGQKQFKRLVKKIDEQRGHLHDWQAAIAAFEKKHTETWDPLLDQYRDRQVDMAVVLDRWLGDPALTKTEHAKLATLLRNMCTDLMQRIGDYPEQAPLFARHAARDEDDGGRALSDAEAGEAIRAMMKEMFGIDVAGPIDPNDPDALAAMLEQHAAEQAAARDAAAGARPARKKTASQLAREAREEAERKNMAMSIREVYRKLASSLHPDRETDPAERARKTDLMQRVNVANDNNDLLQLLELQLEIEQIDERHIDNISDERLKHYNKILKEQLEELDREIGMTVMAFALHADIDPDVLWSPAGLLADLDQDIRMLRAKLENITADIVRFDNPKAVKAFLKTYRPGKPVPRAR